MPRDKVRIYKVMLENLSPSNFRGVVSLQFLPKPGLATYLKKTIPYRIIFFFPTRFWFILTRVHRSLCFRSSEFYRRSSSIISIYVGRFKATRIVKVSSFKDFIYNTRKYRDYRTANWPWAHVHRTFLPISDDMAIPQYPASDSILSAAVGLKLKRSPRDMKLSWSERCLLEYVTSLKVSGSFDEFEAVCRQMTKIGSNALVYYAFLNLGDLFHLRYRWADQVLHHKSIGVITDVFVNSFEPTLEARTKYFESALECYKLASDVCDRPVQANIAMARILASSEISASIKLLASTLEFELAGWERKYLGFYQTRLVALASSEGVGELRAQLSQYDVTRDRYKHLTRAQLCTLAQAEADGRLQTVSVKPEFSGAVQYRRYRAGLISDVNTQIHYPAFRASQIQDCIDLGDGFVMAGYDRILTDTKHLDFKELKLFAPSVLCYDEQKAVLGFDRVEVQFEKRPVILLSGHCPNFYHWILDGMGSLQLLEGTDLLETHDILMPANHKKFHEDILYSVLGEKVKFRKRPDGPSTWSLWRNCVHLQLPGRNNVPHFDSVRFVRKRLGADSNSSKKGKRIFITRYKRWGRKMVNEMELIRLFKSKGFMIVNTEAMTIDQQRNLFRDAEVIAANAGAALANLVFCPSDTRVLIITSEATHYETFTAISSAIGLKTWVYLGEARHFPVPYYLWSIFDFEVELKGIESCIDEVLSVH